MDKNKIRFKARIRQDGGSKVFGIPPELLEFIEADVGDEVILIGDKSKKGKFVAFWKTRKWNKMVSKLMLSNLMQKFHRNFKPITYGEVEKYFKFSEKEKLFCEYCHVELETETKYPHLTAASLDHKTPKFIGGKNEFKNIAICCLRCNIVKGTLNAENYQIVVDLVLIHKDRELLDIILNQWFGGKKIHNLKRLKKEKEASLSDFH